MSLKAPEKQLLSEMRAHLAEYDAVGKRAPSPAFAGFLDAARELVRALEAMDAEPDEGAK